MSETFDAADTRGVLFYDGTCTFCTRWIGRIGPLLRRRNIRTVPFEDGAAEPEMRLRWQDGRELGGADAIVFLSQKIWWATPLGIAARLPGIKPLLDRAYRHVAANRHCRNGACELAPPRTSRRRPWLGWLTLAVFVPLAVWAGNVPIKEGWIAGSTLLNPTLPPWLWMWLLAGALWIGFKVTALEMAGGWRALGRRTPAFFLWVGMDAHSFTKKSTPLPIGIAAPTLRLVSGILLIGYAAPAFEDPVLRGWLGMTGLLFLLHFGLFQWVAAFWNRLGFAVHPIMNAPWRAKSLAEFWGYRWNRAFSDVARISVFRPLVSRFGVAAGTLAGFGFSGLAHELVISLPAGAGYGLPTAYFLIQGVGVLAERRWALRNTRTGRTFLWLVLLAPAFWLFHPPFMTVVIDPFLTFLNLNLLGR